MPVVSAGPEFEHYSEKVAEAFISMPSHTALPDFLGVSFVEAGPGRLVAEMEVRPELLTPFGNLHGGVIAVLVDHVLGSVMYPVMPRGWWAATTEYKVNNLAPVREGTLRAEASIVAMTKRTSVVRIDVTNGERLVCVAQGTCLLQEPKPKPEASGPAEVPEAAPEPARDEVGERALALFERGTAWTAERVAGIRLNQLRSPTPCDEWTVRDVVNHLIGVLNMFTEATKGGALGPPPRGTPPDVAGDDPASAYDEARASTIAAYRAAARGEGTAIGPRTLGVAFVDQLVHGWDIAVATGQDARFPDDLAEAAFGMIDGQIEPAARGPGKIFKDAVPVPVDSSAQDKLIGYTGRHP